MNNLLEFAVKAHGGLDLWKRLESVSADQVTGGVFMQTKGLPNLLENIKFTANLHKQQISHYPYVHPGQYTLFRTNHIEIRGPDSAVLEELTDPHESFEGLTNESKWTNIQLAYFAGYAIWTYLTAPFSFFMPGFETAEIDSWEENGEIWRRLKVLFPDNIDSHSKEQVFYFNKDGLIKRHDYQVLGNSPAAHYVSGHREFQGIVVPTTRRVYVRQPDNKPRLSGPLLVSIDFSNIKFS
jgi:hypothetical protein